MAFDADALQIDLESGTSFAKSGTGPSSVPARLSIYMKTRAYNIYLPNVVSLIKNGKHSNPHTTPSNNAAPETTEACPKQLSHHARTTILKVDITTS